MMRASLNCDPPPIVDASAPRCAANPTDRPRESHLGASSPSQTATSLLAALAIAHAHYRRAIQQAQQATEAGERRAAFAEARRLIARASSLQSRLRE